MATRCFEHVAIKGISAAVPSNTLTNVALNKEHENVDKTANIVGIEQRHISDPNICTSDLCYQAADKILNDLNWDRTSVDAVIFLSQTPDYILPATSCILQHRLGLSINCLAFDMSLGCSGYIYGLLSAFSLINSSGIKRVLLLVGDTISKVLSSDDMPAKVLFGDAGTATAIEFDTTAENSYLLARTDGSGADSLIIPAGGFRKRASDETKVKKQHIKDKVMRSEEDLFMDGSSVFSFTLSQVPKSVNDLLMYSNKRLVDIDLWLFHQANKFMLTYLAQKIGINDQQMLMNIEQFGNTSPPSIPLLAVTEGNDYGFTNKKNWVGMVGFGVGLSWGCMITQLDKIVIPELIFV